MINQLYSQTVRGHLADGGVANILVVCRWSWRGSVEVAVVGILKNWNTEFCRRLSRRPRDTNIALVHIIPTHPFHQVLQLFEEKKLFHQVLQLFEEKKLFHQVLQLFEKKSYFTRFAIVWKILMSLHLVNISATHPLNHVLQYPPKTDGLIHFYYNL